MQNRRIMKSTFFIMLLLFFFYAFDVYTACVCVWKGFWVASTIFHFFTFFFLSLHILHYQESRSSGIEWAQRLFSIYFEINTHKKPSFKMCSRHLFRSPFAILLSIEEITLVILYLLSKSHPLFVVHFNPLKLSEFIPMKNG